MNQVDRKTKQKKNMEKMVRNYHTSSICWCHTQILAIYYFFSWFFCQSYKLDVNSKRNNCVRRKKRMSKCVIFANRRKTIEVTVTIKRVNSKYTMYLQYLFGDFNSYSFYLFKFFFLRSFCCCCFQSILQPYVTTTNKKKY